MVQLDYQRQLRQIMAARQERLAALKTRSDAERYVLAVRRAVRRAFGPLPPRTPLNARTTRALDLADHRIEHILFESRPGFLVTGNLYLPGGAQPGDKLPAVLGLCGHSADGKMAAGYQSFCIELVQQGFVVFIIDPIQQGERVQYTPQDGPPIGLCAAHNMMGNQMSLVGDTFGTWRVWDAIRALDYLWSRPEIDRTRVGVTGNSGGGTLTTYVSALDPRPAWAAPSCYITYWLANLENELPADSEQNPPGLLAAGLDEADLLLCHAPRPTLILGQAKDFFDPRYTRKAWDEVRRVHALLGSPRSAELFIGPTVHGFSPENRAAMVAFALKQVGKRRVKGAPPSEPVDARDLWVTPSGSTVQAGSVRVFERTAARAEDLSRKRGRPAAGQVIKDARRLLAIGPALPALPYRALRAAGGGPTVGIRGQFAVETEPGIEAIVTAYGDFADAMLPPSGAVTLYVGHVSADADVRDLPAVRQLACKPGFVTVDPRGIGQSQPRTCASMDFFEPYGADFLYASLGEMLGQSYLGRRVFDVMRTIDFLLAYGASEVSLVGRGLGATTAAFAALLHPSRPRIRLINYLPSYAILTRSPQFAWPLSSLLRGSLACFDLPDVYRALGRRLRLDDPWDAAMQAQKR
jgi:dienelactone hydrolase